MRESALSLSPEVRQRARERYDHLKTIQPQQRMFWPRGTYCRWIKAHKAALREHVARGFALPESSR